MTKRELAIKIAQKGNLPIRYAEKVLELLPEAILEMKEGERLTIPNFGKFDLLSDRRTKSGLRLEFRPSPVLKAKLQERRARQ